MVMDHYELMRRELATLWEILRKDVKNQSVVDQKLLKINSLAIHIGGKVRDDAEQLNSDVRRFLIGKLDRTAIDRMFQNALKLEQETREL